MIEHKSYLAFIFLGAIGPVHGLALPYLIEGFSLTLGTAGLMFFAGSLGYITASSAYPLLQRKFGVKLLLSMGTLVTIGGLTILPLMPLWPLALAASYIVGLGSGTIEVGFNALIAGLNPERAKPAMNWLHFAFSIGALGGPIVLSRLSIWTGQWMILYWFGALLFLLFFVIWHRSTDLPVDLSGPEGGSEPTPAHIYTSMNFWFLMIGMFIYCGAEVALAGWMTTYLSSEIVMPAETAALGVSFLWGGLTVGRALCGKLSPYVDTRHLLLVLCSGSALFAAATAAVKIPWLSFASIFFTGLFFSAIFPTLILQGTSMFPKTPGAVSGGLVTAAGLGALVVPSMLGFIAERASLSAGIMIVAGMLLFSSFLIWLLPGERVLQQRRKQEVLS